MATFEQHTFGDLLEAIAARTPAPGGGAVAALTAALAAALARMVVRYGASDPASLSTLAGLGAAALRLADDDAAAFARLSALWKLDRNDPARRERWPGAVEAVIAAPQGVIDASLDMLRLLDRLSKTANPRLAGDLAIAAILAHAAAESAAWNVRANLPLLADPAEAARLAARMEDRLKEAKRLKGALSLPTPP